MYNHPKMKYSYCGIDSHKDTHCAVIINCFYEKLGEITFNNVPSDFEKFIRDVEKFKMEGTELAFGMEDISAYGRALTVFLTEKKFVVKHANAGLVAHERKSRNFLNKTDSEDAECASRVLLNRFDQLPQAIPNDKYWILKNFVTRRRFIAKMNAGLKNHAQSFILSHYPYYDRFFSIFDCKSSLAFFEKYPSPSALKGVTVYELDMFFRMVTDNKQWKGKAEKILNFVKKAGDTSTTYQDSRDLIVKSAINQILMNQKEIDKLDKVIDDFLKNFDFNLKSMKGIETVMASNLIAEIGDITRFKTPAKLARYAGVAPVTYASGKMDVQFSNQRGNRILNSIFFHLAVLVTIKVRSNHIVINPFFNTYYKKKMKEGKTKKQALKCVERRLVNIIWKMMTHKVDYINPPTEVEKK